LNSRLKKALGLFRFLVADNHSHWALMKQISLLKQKKVENLEMLSAPVFSAVLSTQTSTHLGKSQNVKSSTHHPLF
jgi:hypothetical protein